MPLKVTTIDDVVNSVRSKTQIPTLPQVDLTPKSFQRQGIEAIKYDVPVSNIYDRLSDGTYTPRFENYKTGFGEEERLAKGQSTAEKWLYGADKFVTKSLAYASDAVIGTAVGIFEGISNGRFDKVWDNSYSNWIDDVNKKLDYALPNYYTDEEKSMNFLQKMTTANFWANDVLGNGLSFVAGALLPEVALAMLSGGSTLPTSLAKFGLKTVGKSVLKAEAKDMLGDVAMQALRRSDDLTKFKMAETAMDATRAYNRANRFGTAGNILNTGRFLTQTSAFEAGMEARQNFNIAMTDYLTNFESKNGRSPSFEEMSEFADDATKAANGVFTANMAILSVSNAAMFGKTFGVGLNFGKKLENAGNRLIGLGIKREAAGKLALQEANKFQKVLGNSYKILSKPAIEGLYEEGLQGVAGKTMQNYLEAKYNSKSEDAYGLWSSLSDAFSDQYGSKEGWNEMGIGMIIGLAGGSFTGAMTGKLVAPEGMGSSSYRARRAELQEQVDIVNKGQSNLQKRIINANGMKNFANNMKSKAEGFESTFIDNALVNREYIKTQEQVKSKKEILKDYDSVVDNMELSDDQIEEIGGAENLELYKQSLKDEFKKNLNDYRFAAKTVKSLGLDRKLKGVGEGSLSDIADAIEMNIMMGKSALDGARNIASQIDRIIGTEGVFNHLEHYNNLSEDQKKNIEEVKKKKRRVKDLTKLANKYGQQLAGIQSEGRGFTDETKKKRYKDASEKRVVVQQELNALNDEINAIEEDLNKSLGVRTFNVDQLTSTETNTHDVGRMVEELDKLDDYIDSLNRSGRTSDAEMLTYLVEEYKAHSDAHREMNNGVRRMMDSNFFSTKEGKGFLNTVLGVPYKLTDEFRQIIRDNDAVIDRSLNLVGYRGTETVEEIISRNIANNPNLSDRDKFKLESIIRLQLGYKKLEKRLINLQSEVDIAEPSNEDPNDPLAGDTIALSKKLNAEGKDLGSLQVLNDLISSIASELDKFKIGRADKALIESLEKQLEELKAQKAQQTAQPSQAQAQALPEVTEDEYKDFVDNNNVSNQRIEDIARKISIGEELSDKEKDIRQARATDIEDILKKTATDIDTKIADIEDQLNKAKGTKSIRIVGSPEYIRLNELNKKKILEGLSAEEQDELTMLEEDIDQWITISGVVVEGLRLSDLIQQKATLENTPIQQLENVTSVTSQEVLDQVDFGEKTQAAYYSIGQSYDAVTAIRVRDANGKPLIEVSGISLSDLKEQVGFDFDAKVNDQNNILLEESVVEQINTNSPISILPTNKNLTTNFSAVIKTETDTNGNQVTKALKSKFNTYFYEQQKSEAIYELSPNQELVLEIDPRDPWNKELIDKYKKAKSEKGKKAALENLKKSLVIRVKDKNGNFVAVLKGKRANAVKTPEALKFEAMRDEIIDDPLIFERFIGIKDAMQLDYEVSVSKVLLGFPNYNFTKNADGTLSIDSKEFTDPDIDKIDDIGYIENGEIKTRENRGDINTTFLNKFVKSPISSKVPFVVVLKGNQRIAYPVKISPRQKESLEEFSKIYKAKTDPVDKATALNRFLAERGVDIKLPGNSFIAVGKSNLNDDFFSDKLAQLEEIDYFNTLDPWADRKSDVRAILKSGVSIDINLSNPFFSPKLSIDFSKVNVQIPTTGAPTTSSNRTSSRGVSALSNAIKNTKNKSC